MLIHVIGLFDHNFLHIHYSLLWISNMHSGPSLNISFKARTPAHTTTIGTRSSAPQTVLQTSAGWTACYVYCSHASLSRSSWWCDTDNVDRRWSHFCRNSTWSDSPATTATRTVSHTWRTGMATGGGHGNPTLEHTRNNNAFKANEMQNVSTFKHTTYRDV